MSKPQQQTSSNPPNMLGAISIIGFLISIILLVNASERDDLIGLGLIIGFSILYTGSEISGKLSEISKKL